MGEICFTFDETGKAKVFTDSRKFIIRLLKCKNTSILKTPVILNFKHLPHSFTFKVNDMSKCHI